MAAWGCAVSALDHIARSLGYVTRADADSMANAAAHAAERAAWSRAVTLADGCHDYMGGFTIGEGYEAFQAGVGTVAAVMRRASQGVRDYQMRAVEAHGAMLARAQSGGAL